MGGRGARSATSSRNRLPGGALAMTVRFASGRSQTYAARSDGAVGISANGVAASVIRPVETDTGLRGLYERARERGYEVTLHSRAEVETARMRYREERASSARDIAAAEVRGTSQSRKLSRFSGRSRSSRG